MTRIPRSPYQGTCSLSRRRRVRVREYSVSWAVIVPATVQNANLYHKGFAVNVDHAARRLPWGRHDRQAWLRTSRLRRELCSRFLDTV